MTTREKLVELREETAQNKANAHDDLPKACRWIAALEARLDLVEETVILGGSIHHAPTEPAPPSRPAAQAPRFFVGPVPVYLGATMLVTVFDRTREPQAPMAFCKNKQDAEAVAAALNVIAVKP